jgi:hypothetical protein
VSLDILSLDVILDQKLTQQPTLERNLVRNPYDGAGPAEVTEFKVDAEAGRDGAPS